MFADQFIEITPDKETQDENGISRVIIPSSRILLLQEMDGKTYVFTVGGNAIPVDETIDELKSVLMFQRNH